MFTGKVSVGRRHQNMINKGKEKVGVASNRKNKRVFIMRACIFRWKSKFRLFANSWMCSCLLKILKHPGFKTHIRVNWKRWRSEISERQTTYLNKNTRRTSYHFFWKKTCGLTIAGREIGWTFWKTTKSGGINRKSAVWTMLLVEFAFTNLLKAPDFSHCATSARTSGPTVVPAAAAVPRWYATFSNWKSRSNFKFRTAELDWSVIFSINYKIIKIFRHCNSLFSSVILRVCRSQF